MAKIQPEEILKLIEDIENDDDTISILEEAMEHYCSTWDKCEGFKHALRLTIEDQYQNHRGEESEDDLDELKRILTKQHGNITI